MTTTNQPATYLVPEYFFTDHQDRDYNSEVEILDMETQGDTLLVRVALTADQRSELLSDAEFYAEGGGGLGPEYRGLQASARATVKRLTTA